MPDNLIKNLNQMNSFLCIYLASFPKLEQDCTLNLDPLGTEYFKLNWSYGKISHTLKDTKYKQTIMNSLLTCWLPMM